MGTSYGSGMADTRLDIRSGLETERADLLARIDELTVGGEVDLEFDDDFADRGLVASEQGENHALADSLQAQLDQVETAIARIDDGSYGTCAICGGAISTERLQAVPASSRCIEHAE